MSDNLRNENAERNNIPQLLEQNVFIVWKPEYILGIPIIDEQHRGIVTMINTLHFGMQNNYIENVLNPIIDMMYDYTHIHFRIEEDLLEKIGYPNIERHRILHNELSVRLTDMSRSTMLGKDPYQFMDFLKQWWLNHICIEDLIYKHHLFSVSK